MTAASTTTAYDHARRAGELLGEALSELALAQGAAVNEREALGPEFGALHWRAASLYAVLTDSAGHARAARERLP